MTAKLLLLASATLLLSACSTISDLGLISSNDEANQEAQSAVTEMQAQSAELQQTITELRSENARLTRTVQTLQRSQQRAKAVRATLEKQAQEQAALAAEKEQKKEILVVPPPPKDPDTIIVAKAEAEAAPLSPSAVPVESTPRLVEPTFAAVGAVFENEAGTNIETTSILFGVHLASYRKTSEVIAGWKNLQRDNPNLLGLLEPRVEQVTIKDRGQFYRLIAGGFSSEEKAVELCQTLKKKKLYCAATDFNGKRLEISAAG